jgi:LuxR family maltose regulon positive regulatory protein
MVTGDLDGASGRLDEAERSLAQAGAPRTVAMDIAMYRAALAQARGDTAGTAAHARRMLELAGPDDHFARAAGSGFLGLAAWAAGDVREALDTFSQTAASLDAAGNLVDALATTVPLAEMWTVAGLPSKARRLLEDALRTAGDALPSADLHVALAELDRLAGDLPAANRHLETATSLGDATSMPENRFRWFVVAARVKQSEGDLDAATALLDRAERLYRAGYFPDVRPIAAMKTRVRIAQGDVGDRAAIAGGTGYLHEFEHLTAARLLLAQRRVDDATSLLSRLLEPARASGREASVLEIRMLQALAHDARGERRLARDTLDAALAAAPEPDGFVQLFRDEGALPEAQRPVSSTAETLSERELEVLRLLDTELSGPEIARELYVSLNTLRTHTKHIFTKLDVTSRRAAVRRAREQGLL